MMAACEKCWNDAYSRSLSDTSKTQVEHYNDLLQERKDNPCDRPDFSVRNLSEYPVEELQLLFNLVYYANVEAGDYDTWLYRIRDAIKEAKKNEKAN